jgi:hypothetical protein
MPTLYGRPSRHVRSVSEKAAYSKKARKKLVESKAKLYDVKAAINRAIATGSLQSGAKLESVQQAMDTRLAAAESRLEALQKSGEAEWEQLRDELENAWEDLSHSINTLVARVKDESD